MKKLISHILVALILSVSIAAQVKENEPKLFDEFGKMPLGETMARLQNLAIEIGNTPNSKALIRIYGGHKDSFGFPYLRGSVMKAVWGNTLKHGHLVPGFALISFASPRAILFVAFSELKRVSG
jgi:hypothetical protein